LPDGSLFPGGPAVWEEEIIVPTETPGTAAAAAQHGRAAPAAQPPRRLSLAPAVTAAAELMIVPGLTVVTGALPHTQNPPGFCGSYPQRAVSA
jgi:hypothetical protein